MRSERRRFAMELCLLAGKLDYEAEMSKLPAKTFRQWEMLHAISPIGSFRDDARSAQIAAMIFNMAVDQKHRKPIKDFLLPYPSLEEGTKQGAPATDVPLWQKQMSAMYQWAALYSAGGMKDSIPVVAEAQPPNPMEAMLAQAKAAAEAQIQAEGK